MLNIQQKRLITTIVFGENKQKQHKTIVINAENDDKQS